VGVSLSLSIISLKVTSTLHFMRFFENPELWMRTERSSFLLILNLVLFTPNTNCKASNRLDLPEPLGPTIAV